MYWLKFPAKVPSPTGPLIDHFTCIVKKKQQFQIEAKCQFFLVKMRFISLRIVKKIYLFSYPLHLPLFIQCIVKGMPGAILMWLICLGLVITVIAKIKMLPPELFSTPPPEGIFDTHHEVRLGTFETKMTTHRDN